MNTDFARLNVNSSDIPQGAMTQTVKEAVGPATARAAAQTARWNAFSNQLGELSAAPASVAVADARAGVALRCANRIADAALAIVGAALRLVR
ncbi:MAG: hypothetical protein JWO69_446 [Thermoleophilia bacterium]|nr:hypothetical protein [Thermoleophilia bacterium]